MSEEKPEPTFFLNEPSAKLSLKQPAVEADSTPRNVERKPEPPEEPPHYHGHRERMKARFQKVGHEGFADYEMLEMLFTARSARVTPNPWPRHCLPATAH
jgi:DNA repair protein RadC